MTSATDLLQEIVGLTMWTGNRAVDMATFQIGRRIDVLDFRGRPRHVGEYALHIQCSWRIFKTDRILVGSQDLYYPADYRDDESIPEGFDWDRDPNRRDQLVKTLFEGPALVINSVALGPAGMCQVEFGDGIVLEIFPTNSGLGEHWRLFDHRDTERTHLVMSTRDGIVGFEDRA